MVRTTKKDSDAERATRLIEELTDELKRVSTEAPDISITIAIDMNTTLRRNYTDQTGEHIMTPKKHHTPATYMSMHELMEHYSLHAPQTFNDNIGEDER